MDEENQVPGTVEGVSNETPNPDRGVSTPSSTVVETPASIAPQVDVEKMRAKYESDINNLKSTLQRKTAQKDREWQERYDALQQQMHETRMSTMSAEERERYERQLESEQFQSLQSRLEELENERATQTATVNAWQFFIQQGVPADKLNLSEGYDTVVANGWQHLTEELATLRAARSNPQTQKPVTPDPLKPAPSVITDKATPSAGGTTWALLRDKFGSDEAVYRAVEEGRLDPSIIPQS